MVQLDWKRVLSSSAKDFSDEEKDDLFNSVAWYEVEPNLDVERLKVVFTVAQEILKYKGEQVESLVVELDELAARQGAEEAQRHRDLIEEVDDLRRQLDRSQKRGTKSSRRNSPESENLKQELLECELSNEKLLTELKEREREVLLEKREVEKFAAQVVSLEREKSELRRELATVQSESRSEQEAFLHQDSSQGPSAEQMRELTESVRQKNKHISQLLNDVEAVEKENVVLREKLSNLRDKLSEATQHMLHLTGEFTGLKLTCNEQEGKINASEEQNVALRNQVQELVNQKLHRDTELDDFSAALDSRVHDWKRLTESKDAEIEELKSRLAHLSAQAPNIEIDTERSRVALLMQTLQTRASQIESLQKELSDATKTIHNTAAIIETLKAKKSRYKTVDSNVKLTAQLQVAEEQIKSLESRIQDAEEDSRAKAEEMTDMIIQLRQYESGEYGLVEAVGEIKELKQQRRVREKQIEELVQASNKLQAETGYLEEQNMALREKLGLPADAQVNVDGILSLRRKEQSLLHLLQHQAERLEEEKLQLKLENRKLRQRAEKLRRRLQLHGDEADVSSVADYADLLTLNRSTQQSIELERTVEGEESQGRVSKEELELKNQQLGYLDGKVQEVIKENESLRKGMHEILDSIHNQDGSSAVQLESQCLERLLEALDSRHVSGWYHPAMRLQGQLQSVEGSNAVLREQLREARSEENKSVKMLQTANFKIEQLEHNLTSLQEGHKSHIPQATAFEEMVLPPNMSLSSAEIVAKLNSHLLHVLNEYNKEKEHNKILEKRLEDIDKQCNIVRHQMGLLYNQYGDEKNEWKAAEAKLVTEQERLESCVESLQTKVEEFEVHWAALDKSEDEQKRLISESAKKTAAAKSSEVDAVRKCKFLQDLENHLRKSNSQLVENLSSIECKSLQEIGELKRHKEMSTFRIASLQKTLDYSVPIIKLDMANKEINELTAKYRDLLQKEQSLISESQLASRLEGEVEILHKDKIELSNALQETREKLHSLEVLVMSFNQDTVTQDTHDNQIAFLTKKLATLEMKELNEKQRADHADKMYQILKGQLGKLEEWNSEVMAQNKIVIEQNLEFQRVERELRDNLISFVSREELQLVEGKLSEAETRLLDVKLEKETMSEMLDIAQQQVRTLELRKTSHDCELDSLKQLVLNLQAASDDKVIIAQVSHEMQAARLAEAAAGKTVQHLQNEVLKLRATNLHQEAKLDKNERDFNQVRNQLANRCQSLLQVIQILRRQYSGSVPLTKVERFSESLRHLREERSESRKIFQEAEKVKHDVETKKELLEVEIQSLNDLKQTLTSDSVQVIDWNNKLTEIILKELHARHKVEFLEVQLQQAEERFQKQENYIETLEREAIYEERNLHLQHAETESPVSQKTAVSVQLQTIEVPVVTTIAKPVADRDHSATGDNGQARNLLMCKAEVSKLKHQLELLNQELKEKDGLLITKDRAISELARRPSVTIDDATQIRETYSEKSIPETKEKQALQATVDSMRSIVAQKEDTVARYQLLLKEARDEHSRAAAEAQDELRGVQTALANQQQAYAKLKARLVRQTRPSVSTIEQYISRIHELEDEVAEMGAAVGELRGRLEASRAEADRWRGLADDRLQNMGDLRQRLEDQHRAELQVHQIESQRYQAETETFRQDLNKIKEEFQQQMEMALKGPTTLISTLQAQLKERDQMINSLNETLGKVRHELNQKTEAIAVKKMARAKSADDIQSVKNQLNTANTELKLAKEELHKLQMKSREVWMKRKEELKTEREEAHQKKIKAMEEGFREEKEKLEKEMAEMVKKRVKTTEEVARWEERKKCQQTVEKLKERLAERTREEEKLLKTDKALRDTIARLDREKIALMSRSSKGSGAMEARIEALETERAKLLAEVAASRNRLEMQKHHSGGLGAVMLEERLEAQQRRITTLELSKKGSKAVAEELEKLQEANAILKKANLRLESENLELRLDLERVRTDAPRLKEKVSHLEKYISILKAESSGVGTSDSDDTIMSSERKSIAELEKTILVLKRVVEKLQKDNKRLADTKKDNVNETQMSVDRLQRELTSIEAEKKKLQDHYLMAMEQTNRLEAELDKSQHNARSMEAKVSSLSTECEVLKSQLVQKTLLVDRVKGLLQRAAAKEKLLHEQVTKLQRLVPPDSLKSFSSQSNMAVR